MMIVITFVCFGLLLTIQYIPYWLGVIICILLVQRVLEFMIVYSRNFIFNRGRIFSLFHDPQKRGEWLIVMFALNVMQLVLIFALWYQMISIANPESFSHPLHILDSLYFSFATYITVGYGDIYPVSSLARITTIMQMSLFFYTIVIVINGLISIHFNKKTS
ncbi:MAG: ion channel [Patescibacteria group bacterium]